VQTTKAVSLPASLGFRGGTTSVHTSRTMMLDELSLVLASVAPNAAAEAYISAIVAENVLGKRTQTTRQRSAKRLTELYALNQKYPARFRPTTLHSTAQNLASSWTQAGFLVGKIKKSRSRPVVTPVVAAFACVLGCLWGSRGRLSLDSTSIQCSRQRFVATRTLFPGKSLFAVQVYASAWSTSGK